MMNVKNKKQMFIKNENMYCNVRIHANSTIKQTTLCHFPIKTKPISQYINEQNILEEWPKTHTDDKNIEKKKTLKSARK